VERREGVVEGAIGPLVAGPAPVTTDSRFSNDWSEAELLTLRRLWAEGVTAMAIGREMGRTRNSVVGKAHRLLLAPRPSPIGQKRGEVREAKPRPVVVRVRLRPVQIASLGRRPPAPPPSAPPEPPQAPEAGWGTCTWVTSEGRPWTFCGAPVAAPGRSFCAEHHAIAYHPIPRRRLEAA
jgi:GcrA cell cycle regulator